MVNPAEIGIAAATGRLAAAALVGGVIGLEREVDGHEAGVRTHLAGNLSPYKRPARIELIDAMPTTANGKLLKRELKARCVPASG